MASPPSPQEQQFYYFGLHSRPLLVARSSNTSWLPGFEGVPSVPKALYPVGDHSIVEIWSQQLVPQLCKALIDFPWQTLDLVRMGLRSGHIESFTDFPVILWISVRPQSTDWHSGQQCIKKCLEILRAHSQYDVQCEIRETSLTPYAGPSLLGPDTCEDMLPFTTTLGQSIAAANDEYREGTFALFLNESGSSKLFGLTCRHVLFPDSNKAAYKWIETLPKIELVQPGTGTLDERREDVKGTLQAWNSSAANKFSDVAETHRIQAKKNLETIESLKEVSTRVVGHVVFSPAYELFESEWLEDFAVIELDKEKFKNGIKNVVVIDSIAWERKHASKVDENFNDFRNDPPRLLQLRSAVSMTKLFDKKWKTDSDGDYFQVVGKRGNSTRLTFGYLNDVMSIQRLGRDDYSQELCISSFKHTSFSEKGDSGSAVFDVQGNVYGMITSGHTGLTTRTDITYVTPLDRILTRIEKDEGRRFEIP